MKKRAILITWALVLLLTALVLNFGNPPQQVAAAGQKPQGATSGQAAHYIVFEKHPDGTTIPVFYRLVELSAPLHSLSDEQVSAALAQPSRNSEQISVSLQTSTGQVVFQNVVQVSPWLRGEFSTGNPADPIDGHLIPLETIAFVVRLPQIDATTLILTSGKLQSTVRFDLHQLTLNTPQIELDPTAQETSYNITSGPASNRVDFLVMGDGYTSSQSAKFSADAAATTANFFSIAPYSLYKNYFNLRSLFTASSQSGADHPPYNASCSPYDATCCSDPAMQSDPLRGKMVTTAFESRFCANGIHRLLVSNQSKVLAAAAAVPDWDTILLMVNDSTYGGSGGYISTVSMHSAAAQIAQHEFGHSFVNLADEYDSPYPGFPTCSDKTGSSPCESNVTDVTSRTLIKWKAWIKATTQIPTPNQPAYDGLVGLFQGARYKSTGMYRPGYGCIMRYLGAPYCQIPSQSFVLTLYKGGWGVPSTGVSLIEPGSQTPANPTVKLIHPATQIFHANSLSPVGGPVSKIIWLKNGVAIPGATTSTYTYTTSASDPALVHITMRVKDVTTLVHPSAAGTTLQNEFTWNVTVSTSLISISGNAGVPGAILKYIDGTAKTVTANANGLYSIKVPYNWSGRVTPTKAGVTSFTPAYRNYTALKTNQTSQNYKPNHLAAFSSIAAQDGYIFESAENSNVGGGLNATASFFAVGDNYGNRQIRGLLSFNTATLPDNAVIVSATLRLKLQATVGANPFNTHGLLAIDIKSPNFGASPVLQLDDFAAPAGLNSAGTLGKTPVNGSYVAKLVGPAFTKISKVGTTQLRLRFALDDDNDAITDWLAFFSGNAPVAANRPLLQIVYYIP